MDFDTRKASYRSAVLLLAFSFGPLQPATAQSGIFVPTPEQVRLSEILIATPQPYDQAQVSNAQKKAHEIRAAIQRGENFEDLAKAYSQGPSAGKGGDLGYFVRGKLAANLENVVFAMEAGQTSDVIRTKQGYVILEVTDRIEHGKIPLEVLNAPITRELTPYLQEVTKKVRKQWYRIVADSAQGTTKKQGHVAVRFVLHHDGVIADQKIFSPSGDASLDNAALRAVEQANPFSSFPSGVSVSDLILLIHFEYNPEKGAALH